MFFNKKTKNEQPVTPEELSNYIDKSVANPVIKHLHIRNDAIDVIKYKRRKRMLSIIIGFIITTLLLIFIISTFNTQWGDLVISVDSFAGRKGVIISEDPEFNSFTTILSAEKPNEVTNFTYSWLPEDLDTSVNGSHNGENYIAYTFYCKNNGNEPIDYEAYIEITGVAKSVDEAVRVLVYKNGQPEIYAKAKYDDRNTAEADCTMFESESRVMTTLTEGFEVDAVDKYTIVIWVEGNDPECIDDIRGGHVRMRMLFEVKGGKSGNGLFGGAALN